MSRRVSHGVVFAFVLLAATPASADPRLPAMFGDHMVLQRGRAIPVWGHADPGEAITVTLDGASGQTTAGKDGRWRVDLPARDAGGPLTLTVAGRATRRFRDVLVGEVWVASGQSNMALELSRASAADAAAAMHEQIRLFTVPRTSTLEPLSTITASWQRCTPASAAPFSAVAYYFGRRLHEHLGVPVGLIHTSWPGSAAEEWTAPALLEKDARFTAINDAWQKRRAVWVGGEHTPVPFDLRIGAVDLVASGGGQPPVSLGPATLATWGFTWDEAPELAFERPRGPGAIARLHGELRARDAGRLRVRVDPVPATAGLAVYDGVRLRVSGTSSFRLRVLQPSITDGDEYASEPITATTEMREIVVPLRAMKQAGWGVQKPFTPEAITALEIEPLLGPNGARPPAGLFHAMVLPVVPYAIQGAIWYQGESNASRGRQYRALLPALIQSWRGAWGQGDFPFLVVQLPNFRDRSPVPQESGWAEVREAQAMTLRVPNTGLAVTIDVGEAIDIHPVNKRPVGERLARWALGTTYGWQGVYSGPFYESMQVDGNTVRLRFRHRGGGLTTTDHRPLRGFAIAGEDRTFVWARAEIDGETVVVSHPDVATPVAVRYAWADNPDGNLGNVDGLPASPFRTDDWQR